MISVYVECSLNNMVIKEVFRRARKRLCGFGVQGGRRYIA
jgi:hypothetical protein